MGLVYLDVDGTNFDCLDTVFRRYGFNERKREVDNKRESG